MNRAAFAFYFFCVLTTLLSNNVEALWGRRGIVGGYDAEEGWFPYHVSVENNRGTSVCGGSILSDRFVITAAHCVVNDTTGKFDNVPLKVVAGIIHLESGSKDRVAADIIEIYVPTEYDPTDKTKVAIGDIAVLKLNSNLGIEENVKLTGVDLPDKDNNYNGVEAVVSGFGYNSIDVIINPETGKEEETNGQRFGHLRYATAKVVSLENCQVHYDKPLSDKHLCAAVDQCDKNKPEGVCAGDSGGPLIYRGVQIGVVKSSPTGCREGIAPAIYTRVSKFTDFINKVVDGKTDDTIRSTSFN